MNEAQEWKHLGISQTFKTWIDVEMFEEILDPN